jgi:N-methylhydantoinase B
MLIESYELVPDSGGAGKHRGGLGSRMQIRMLSPATLFAFIEKAKSPHWGIDGGKEGLSNNLLIKLVGKEGIEALKTSGMQLDKGYHVIATAGGGGGYGNPRQRDVAEVRRDVLNGYVSLDGARRDYGVVIDPDTLEVDVTATQKLRGKQLT